MVFEVKTVVFAGPLELLLSLIEKRKLLVNDISLATVADDFIVYVKSLADFPLAESAHFILIASTLLLIKSKSLLPMLSLTSEEEDDIRSLELRLKIYERVRGLTQTVKERLGREILFPFEERPATPLFSPDAGMTLKNLSVAIREVLHSFPKPETLPKTMVERVMSLETMIGNLTTRITETMKMSFREFSKKDGAKKSHIIVSFLALLELVKQGIVSVTQDKHFEDIVMEHRR